VGQDLAVGREDVAARLGEVTRGDAGVAGIVGESVGVDDLHVVELNEQGEKQNEHAQADKANLAVHEPVEMRRRRASRM
jgi:hypothetical protein